VTSQSGNLVAVRSISIAGRLGAAGAAAAADGPLSFGDVVGAGILIYTTVQAVEAAREHHRGRRSPQAYRGMKVGPTGQPLIGDGARSLGIRPGVDIPVRDGIVSTGVHGMSVTIGSPFALPSHRRTPEIGGEGNPVWSIDPRALPPTLLLRPDPRELGHFRVSRF
jgi:hypothetical protein